MQPPDESPGRARPERPPPAPAPWDDRCWGLLNHVSELVCVHGVDGRLLYLNRAALAAVGHSRAEALARSVFELLPAGYRALVDALLAPDARAELTGELVLHGDGGTDRAVEVRVRLERGGDGADVIHCLGRDLAAAGAAAELARLQYQELHALLDNAPDIIARFDRQHRHLFVNRAIERATGLPRDAFLGRTNRELGMPEEPVATWTRVLDHVFERGESVVHEFAFETPDGARHYQSRIAPEHALDGSVVSVLSATRDVTEEREAQARLRRQVAFRESLVELVEASLAHGLDESFYQRLLEGAARIIPGAQGGSLLLRTDDGHFRFAATVAFDLAELEGVLFSEHELLRRADTTGPRLIPAFREAYPEDRLDAERRAPLYRAGPTERIEVTLSVPVTVDGTNMAYLNLDNFESGDAFDDEAVAMARVFAGLVAALWRRLRLESDLQHERAAFEHLAFHDVVTGLPNRNLFHDRVEQAIERSARTGRPIAVMLLDLDNFKLVNDVHGHDAGDELLRQVAVGLRTCIREGDTVARLGGDEFVVLLIDLQRPEDAGRVAEAIRRRMREPMEVGGRALQTSVSIGIDTFPGLARTREDLLKNADVALYRAMARGKDTFLYCTHEMNVRLRHRTALETELREALERGRLELRFQPRVELGSGAITSFEALARWRHPRWGEVPQDEFIALAEETGLIRSLGHHVLDAACRQARSWERQATPYRVAVNLSARQLRQDDAVGRIEQLLVDHGLTASRLELELTESAAMTEVEGAIEKLGALQQLGIYLSLDDFGTGHSSLDDVRRLPFDALKIDRSFIRELETEAGAVPRASSVVQAMVALGKSFDLTVVAEGVESAQQARLLADLGCDEAQGFFFGRPVPSEEASAMAREGRIRRTF